MKKITINGKPYISIKNLWIALNSAKKLADLCMKQEKPINAAVDFVIHHIWAEELRKCKSEEERAFYLEEPGDYIVFKATKKDGPKYDFQYFKEYSEKQAELTDDEQQAMRFNYRGMAESVAAEMGEGWDTVDLSPEAQYEMQRKKENLLRFINEEEDMVEESECADCEGRDCTMCGVRQEAESDV